VVSWLGLVQGSLQRVRGVVGELYAVHVSGVISFVSFQGAEGYAAAFVATFLSPRLIQHRLGKNGPLVQTARF
jgi:hypothetical protein